MKQVGIFILVCTISLFANLAIAAPGNVSSDVKQSVEQLTTQLNINTATVEQLMSLPGIGEAKAKAIIAFRKQHGNFVAIDDLTLVKGVGDKLLAKFAGQVVLK